MQLKVGDDVLLAKGEYDDLDSTALGKPAGGSAGNVEIDGVPYASPIPKEVIDMIRTAVPTQYLTYIEVPKCGHPIVNWMCDNPVDAKRLLQQLDAFLKK